MRKTISMDEKIRFADRKLEQHWDFSFGDEVLDLVVNFHKEPPKKVK